MRSVIQRVQTGRVLVNGESTGEIGLGVVILLGIGPGDNSQKVVQMARKIAHLRIFEDAMGKMNLSLLDIQGAVLVISQFTLYGDTRKGNRPSFSQAAPPDMARALIEEFVDALRQHGIHTQTGIFGAHMLVEINNDGPVTILLEDE